VGVVGKGRLRYALAAVVFGVFALAVVSAAVAGAAAKKPAPLVAKATCGTLTLKKGGSGVLKVTAAKGSMPVVSVSLASAAKTKVRTITAAGKTSFRYKLAKNKGAAEKVRVLVTFQKGKAKKTATIVCSVRIGSGSAVLNIAMDGGGEGSVTAAPSGTSCASDKAPCAQTYKPGKKITLKAEPATSSTFEGWGGSCKGTASCVVTANGIRTVVARFVKKKFTVTIEKAGDGDGKISSDGAIACGTTCTATVDAGTIVRLKSEADGNSLWVGWTGECTSKSTTCNFPVDGDITVTATFDRKGNRLNVSRSGSAGNGGTITADEPGIDCGDSCSYTYAAGTVVHLTAAAQDGYLFAGWFGDCAGTTGPVCTLTMDAAHFAAADFKKAVRITVAVSGTGNVTSKPAGIDCGSTCSFLFFPSTIITLTANGANFVGWSDSCPAIAGRECTVATDPTSPPPLITATFS
jgi:uncharacterized repeat protein (TIGR02543 family)